MEVDGAWGSGGGADVEADSASSADIGIDLGSPRFHRDGIFNWASLYADRADRPAKSKASNRVNFCNTHRNGRIHSQDPCFAHGYAGHVITHDTWLRIRIDDWKPRENTLAFGRSKNCMWRTRLNTRITFGATNNKFRLRNCMGRSMHKTTSSRLP